MLNNILKNIYYSKEILGKKNSNKFFFLVVINIFASIIELLSIFSLLPVLIILMSESELNSIKIFQILNINYDEYNRVQLLKYSLIFFAGIFIFKFVFLLFTKYINAKTIFEIRRNLSNNLFNIYLNNNYKFHSENNSSILIRNQTTSIYSFANILIVFLNLILELFLIILTILAGIFINFKLTVTLFFLLFLLGSLYFILIKKKSLNIGKKKLKEEANYYKQIIASLSSIKEIKIYENEFYFIKKLKNITKKVRLYSIFESFFQSMPIIFLEFIFVSFFLIFLFFYSSFNTNFEKLLLSLSIGVVLSFRLIPASSRIIANFQNIIIAIPNIEILKKQFSKKIKKKKNLVKIDPKNNIKLIDINLNFNKNVIFEKVNLTFFKNNIYGILGPSGSGKSSLINIISGLKNQNSGQIFIDGKKLDNKKNYLNVGLVSRDSYMLDDTIKNNILFGSKIINEKKLIKVAKKAEIYDFIENQRYKMNTLTGERGNKISDGQKQRIFIARAIYRDPSILIFDEATNSLDKKNEFKILNTIKKMRKDRIIIIISHDADIVNKICNFVYEINPNTKNITKSK